MKIPVSVHPGPTETQNNKSISFSASEQFHGMNRLQFKLNMYHFSIIRNEEDRKNNRFLVEAVCVSLVVHDTGEFR